MARVFFRYSEEVLAALAAQYGLERKGLIGALQKREEAGEKVVWPRQEAPSNGTWYLDYRDAAKARQQPSVTARTKSEAEKRLRDALNDTDDAKAGRRPMRFRPTRLSEAAAEMLKLREGTPSYVMDELNLRLHVLPFVGKKFLTELTPADVEELAAQLSRGGKGRKPLSPGSVQQAIRRLASVFTWAKKKKLFFGDSPTREAKRPKIPKRLPKRLSDAQVVKLLSESRQWHDLFWFAATTGLREGELCALEWSDLVLDTDEPHAVVARSHRSDTPKDFEERVVPIPRDVATMLRRRRDAAVSRYVWPGADGEMQRCADSVYGDAFKEAAVRAGLVRGWAHPCNCGHQFFAPTRRPRRCPKCQSTVLPKVLRGEFTFRHLRSTYASALGNPVLAQKALGHSNLNTTMVHYYQVDAAKVREAADVLPFAMGAGRLAEVGQMRDKSTQHSSHEERSTMHVSAIPPLSPSIQAFGRWSRTTPSQYSLP